MVSPNTLLLPFAPKTVPVSSMQDSILLINPVTGVLVLVSQEACPTFQRRREQRSLRRRPHLHAVPGSIVSPTDEEPTRNLYFDYSGI